MIPDGRTEWTEGRRQNYIPPTSSGDKNDLQAQGEVKLQDIQGYYPEFPVCECSLLHILFKHFIHLISPLSVKWYTCRWQLRLANTETFTYTVYIPYMDGSSTVLKS